MSRAFMKEGDDQWLPDIAPTLSALLYFLTKENNGVRVNVKTEKIDENGKTRYEMSNGLTYLLDAQGKWSTVE